MTLGTVASVVGIAGGLNSLFGGGSGSSSQLQAGTHAAANAADPFGPYRDLFGGTLARNFGQLTTFDPDQIKTDPAYQFQLQQGTNAVNRGAAAQGTLGSGNRLIALQELGQGLASNFEDKAWQRQMQTLGYLGNFSGASNGNMGAAGNILDNGAANQYGAFGSGLNSLASGLGGLSKNWGGLGSIFGGGGGAPNPMIWAGGGYGG